MTALGFVLHIYCRSSPIVHWDESHLRLTTGYRPAGPALGAAPLLTVVTYRLTFMAQHALLDFLGQDQVARLSSGPDFVTVQFSLWAWGCAWQGEAHRHVLSSVIGRTKSKCIVLSACENCPEWIPVWFRRSAFVKYRHYIPSRKILCKGHYNVKTISRNVQTDLHYSHHYALSSSY